MKAALIGLGIVADTHVQAIADLDNLSLAEICGRNAEKAQAYSDKIAPLSDISRISTSPFSNIAADPDVDFAIICTEANLPLGIVFQHRMRDSS